MPPRKANTTIYHCCWRVCPVATLKLWTDDEVAAVPAVKALFDDIRATRKSAFVNNFWRALANQPGLLERTWASVKKVMIEPGVLDPLTKELVYIAISTANSCTYCIHSHTAAARAKGLSDEQYAEFLAVIGLAAETNTLANSMQIPVDQEFLIK
jgi:AhpD family alkylhydroperoxidase